MRTAALIAVAAGLAAAYPLTAQLPAFQVGAAAGVSITTVVGDDADAKSRVTPFYGGIVTFHPASSRFGLEAGILAVSKGASRNLAGGGRNTLKISYIEFPLLLRFAGRIPQSDVRPVLSVGGSVGVRSSCVVEGTVDNALVALDCEGFELAPFLDPYFLDFGAAAGLSVDVPVRNRIVLAPMVRYTRGLRNIAATFDGSGVKHSALQLGVAVRF